jgi:hypothetical protein
MSLANIISAVGTILATTTGVGANVHAYERWANDDVAFKNLFLSEDKILGWTITREATDCFEYVGSTLDTHAIVIRGYFSVQDSANTEKTFQDLIEAIRTTFNPNRRLRIAGVSQCHSSDRIQVRTVDHRMFGGYLCHYCELILRVREMVSA